LLATVLAGFGGYLRRPAPDDLPPQRGPFPVIDSAEVGVDGAVVDVDALVGELPVGDVKIEHALIVASTPSAKRQTLVVCLPNSEWFSGTISG
jgi:hypothetical protein